MDGEWDKPGLYGSGDTRVERCMAVSKIAPIATMFSLIQSFSCDMLHSISKSHRIPHFDLRSVAFPHRHPYIRPPD